MKDIEQIFDWVSDEAIRFTGLDNAIVGYDHRGNLVYDYHKMLEIFMEDMTEEEAVDWIDYNVLGTNAGMDFTVIYSNEAVLHNIPS
jgi:hypothetical protein